ncbi:MAG: hypothetical protein ACKO2P_13555 [Planctomycetota bacterium]
MGTGYPDERSGGLPAAIGGDLSAQLQMVRPWLGDSADEPVLFAQHLGRHGGWPFSRHVFAYVTTRRVFVLHARGSQVLRVGAFELESLRQVELIIPSSGGIWVLVSLVLAASIPSFGLSLLLLPFVPFLHARWSPLGLRCTGAGIDLWCVGSRGELQQMHQLFRMISDMCDGLRRRQQGLEWECPWPPVLPVRPPPPPTSPGPVPAPPRSQGAATAGGGAGGNGTGTATASPAASGLGANRSEQTVAGSRRAASPLQEAERRLSAGDLAGARRILDGVPAADRGAEFDRMYSRTIPSTGTELEELQAQFQRLMAERQFAGRERVAKRILELSPQNQKAAAELQALRGRRETLRGLLQKCGGKAPAAGSDDAAKLEWTLKAMDPEAEPQLAEQCRRLLGIR